MAESLNVTKRKETGTLRMRRLRKAGHIPAILYGHGEDNVMLNVRESELNKVIQHGGHVVQLAGDVSENAFIKHVQWDACGLNVVHLDLARINAKEEVEVTLPIELKGDAPGTHEGGVVKFLRHEITIGCPADKLPDKLILKINGLELNGLILASEISLPDGARLISPETEAIVGCSLPVAEAEGLAEGAAAEPEVIGKVKEEQTD